MDTSFAISSRWLTSETSKDHLLAVVLRVLKGNLIRRWKKKCSWVFAYVSLIVSCEMPSNLIEIMVEKCI